MNFNYYVYVGGPIDSFLGTFTIGEFEDYLHNCIEYDPTASNELDEGTYNHNGPSGIGFASIAAYMRFFTDNDLREPIRLFALPGEMDMQYGFIAKLDNNGTTYVFSPDELPYLEKKCGFSLVSTPNSKTTE